MSLSMHCFYGMILVQDLSSLIELYASANQISDIRQLFCLKSMTNLTVMDFSYNPISSSSGYRPFTLYHLSFIRALDGQPVVSLIKDFLISNDFLSLSVGGK